MRQDRTTTIAGAVGLCALLLAGCSGPDPGTDVDETEETPHGHIEGAEELSEPHYRLVVADTETGEVGLLDLITEETTAFEGTSGVDGISGDGRFAYLHASGRETLDILDSGVWTVDHGDHKHYYRTESGPVGSVDAPASPLVITDTALTSLAGPDGASSLLDRSGLEEGTVEEIVPDLTGNAVVLPYAGRLIVIEDGSVRVHERDGSPLEELEPTCVDPNGAAVTRRGLVVGCEEGTLHITEEDGTPTAETLDHPEEGRSGALRHRPGSAVLATTSTEGDLWVLDLAAAEWRAFEAHDVVDAVAIGEGAPVLVLEGDGTLRSVDPETGEEDASVHLLDEVDAAHPPALQVDAGRAYVNDAHAGLVHEIDHGDDLRVARSLDPGVTPDLMVETGW
ncbi:ABC transporter [Nocardiopsis alba]|uniref:ABC transporter n=1 Tax=Nocardiopsis alba TaxID=53437 RepID=UPI00367001AB